MGSWSLLTSKVICMVGNVHSRLPPLFILGGKGGRRDSQLGNAAGAFIPRGWPTFRFFIKVGTARSAAHSFFAGTSSWLGVQPSRSYAPSPILAG